MQDNKIKTANILNIGKRINNKKRSFLFINPVQAKQIPVSPSKAIGMMKELGTMLSLQYPYNRLVIGFAETATAIGVVVASCFNQCNYIHTTREVIPNSYTKIDFKEEHSHAVLQQLVTENLNAYLSCTDSIIFVDDEISTGKTFINIIQELRLKFPILSTKKIVLSSIFNKMSVSDELIFKEENIDIQYLYKLPNIDFTESIANLAVEEAKTIASCCYNIHSVPISSLQLENPRFGVDIKEYCDSCNRLAISFIEQFYNKFKSNESIVILGTEECMYPALVLGENLETANNVNIFCHSTTRSPIGICDNYDYPITNGFKIMSFYDSQRITYLYNLRKYDHVIVVSDTDLSDWSAFYGIIDIFKLFGCRNYYYVCCNKEEYFTVTI